MSERHVHLSVSTEETDGENLGALPVRNPSGASEANELCLGCKKAPIEFMTDGCKHSLFCKRCAMKCASGGKCKVCHQWYANLERIR